MTDRDHGITDADVIGEGVSVKSWWFPDLWLWELRDTKPVGFDGFGRIVWGDEVIDKGCGDTQAEAEAAGAAAKEEYLRSLTSRK
jgi:hypothetical protein